MVIIKFIICALLIFFAGSRLSKLGDVIAEKSGLGHAWIGLVLLAAVTSLPELFNGISAVAFVGVPDLAVGNVVGACLVNMATIGGLDLYLFLRKKPSIFSEIGKPNRLILSFGMILASVFAIGVVLSQKVFDFSLFGVGIYSILIFVIYLIAQRMVYISAMDRNREGEELEHQNKDIKIVGLKFAFFAAIVIAAGIWLPFIGDEIARVFGLGQSFVGVLFLGIATTLPELVVSSTALKYSTAMAVGNLLGSNLFNLSLLFIDDIFYRGGSLFKVVSYSQFVIGLFLVASFLLLIFALKMKSKSRLVSVGLIVSYVAGIATIYFLN